MDKDLFKLIYGGLSFEEAEKYFKGRLPIKKTEYNKLNEKYKKKAFTVGGYTRIEIVKQFHDELLKAIEKGTTLETFKQEMNSFLEKKGYEGIGKFQSENIFRTNIQTSYNAGHYESMTSKEALELMPYWEYVAVEDDQTRPTHKAMDGMVYPANHEVWDTWFPPNGYKCRCTVRSLSKRQVENKKAEIRKEMPPIVPDEGFHTNPAKSEFEPDLKDYPKSLQKAYTRIQKENR